MDHPSTHAHYQDVMNSLLEQQEELDATQSVIRTVFWRRKLICTHRPSKIKTNPKGRQATGFEAHVLACNKFQESIKKHSESEKNTSWLGMSPMTHHKDWSTLSSSNIRAPFLYTLPRARGLRVPLLEHTHVPMTPLPLPWQFRD